MLHLLLSFILFLFIITPDTWSRKLWSNFFWKFFWWHLWNSSEKLLTLLSSSYLVQPLSSLAVNRALQIRLFSGAFTILPTIPFLYLRRLESAIKIHYLAFFGTPPIQAAVKPLFLVVYKGDPNHLGTCL